MLARAFLSLAVGSQLLLCDAFAVTGSAGLRPIGRLMVSGVRQGQSPSGQNEAVPGVRRSGRIAMKSADPADARAKALKQLETFEREDYICPWWTKNGNVNSIA